MPDAVKMDAQRGASGIAAVVDPRQADDVDFAPTTSFGERLLALRRQALAEGQTLLTREEIEREIAERRGGVGATQGDR